MNHANVYYRRKLVNMLPVSVVDGLLLDHGQDVMLKLPDNIDERRDVLMFVLGEKGEARTAVMREVQMMAGLNP